MYKFTYRVRTFRDGKADTIRTETVVCNNRMEFLLLLDHWNGLGASSNRSQLTYVYTSIDKEGVRISPKDYDTVKWYHASVHYGKVR